MRETRAASTFGRRALRVWLSLVTETSLIEIRHLSPDIFFPRTSCGISSRLIAVALPHRVSMLSRHGFLSTPRSLMRPSSRIFSTTSVSCLPRQKPDRDNGQSAKSSREDHTSSKKPSKSQLKRASSLRKLLAKEKLFRKSSNKEAAELQAKGALLLRSTLINDRKKSQPKSEITSGKRSKGEPAKPQPETRAKEVPKPTPLLGLLERQARLEQSISRSVAVAKGQATSRTRAIIASSDKHHDLQSFNQFVEQSGLSSQSTVYVGTLYEYRVMESLKAFGFRLHRSGKSNDKGIDLIGHWDLPGEPHQIKVLVQCKVPRASPATIRELEGAPAGAPSEWQGEGVLALLASSKPLTRGVVDGVQRSPSPVGALHVDPDGYIRQFIWNAVAGERGLAGVGVTTKYEEVPSTKPTAPKGTTMPLKTVSLTWQGNPFSLKMNSE